MELERKIKIEIIVPNESSDAILHKVRNMFHETFKGNSDYVESNVIVWDNRITDEDMFSETGILVDYNTLENKEDTNNRFTKAVNNCLNIINE